MNTEEAIRNLELISTTLDKTANKPENYNTEWAYYLEQMSFQMHKMSQDLREIGYHFGLTK